MVSDKEVSITRIHVVQKVNQLLTSAISTGVSDIHFEPFEDVFRARFRIDGVLKDVEHLPYAQKEEIISRIKIMSDLDIAEKRQTSGWQINRVTK